MKSDRQNISKHVQWQEVGWMLMNSEIHEGENVRNHLMQIPTYGDLKRKLSKHTFIFSASKELALRFKWSENLFYFTDVLPGHPAQ